MIPHIGAGMLEGITGCRKFALNSSERVDLIDFFGIC
jgi:hypothetical protein